MTERLYYSDSYLREFDARVVERAGDMVYLDRTAFYPTSGGQPCDAGTIGDAAVVDVFEQGERIAHRVAGSVPGDAVCCRIDWERRFDHMQQHTGQHLLSAVFEAQYGARTLSFHLGAESATIDLDQPSLDGAAVRAAEERANRAVFENRAVHIAFEDAGQVEGLRKPSAREGLIRVVTIDALDRSACGGTHVRATGEIGPILLRRLERVRDALRVEFLCGSRAVRRARADYTALTSVSQLYSAALDDTPAMAAAQFEALRAAEKQRRAIEKELAAYRGRDLYDNTPPGGDGLRRATERVTGGGALEEKRALAQSFTSRPGAVYLAVAEHPPAVLLAVSADAGIDAGKRLQAALAAAGGRGGGSARMAQGSAPDAAAMARALALLAI